MTPPAAWLASFTRRWHCNPDLCHTIDPISGHGARMAILALHYWPDASRELLVACVVHDLGEAATGDVPWPAKRDCPELAGCLDVLEGRARVAMGMDVPWTLDMDDFRRLKFLDRLDAYLWVKHHAPHVLQRDDWKRDEEALEAMMAEVAG